MARAQIKYVVTDQRSGKVIQNAKVFVYESGTVTPVTDLFAALTGGAAIAGGALTSNAQGEVEGYVTTPRNVKLLVTDNGNTCYYPNTPGNTLDFPDFPEDPTPAYEDPVEEEAEDAVLGGVNASDPAYGFATSGSEAANKTALQAAVNAAVATGRPLYIGPGTFNVAIATPLTVTGDLTIRGAAELLTKIKLGPDAPAAGSSFLTLSSGVTLTLEDLHIEGPNTAGTAYLTGVLTDSTDGSTVITRRVTIDLVESPLKGDGDANAAAADIAQNVLDLSDSTFAARAGAAGTAAGIQSNGGEVKMRNCAVSASGGTAGQVHPLYTAYHVGLDIDGLDIGVSNGYGVHVNGGNVAVLPSKLILRNIFKTGAGNSGQATILTHPTATMFVQNLVCDPSTSIYYAVALRGGELILDGFHIKAGWGFLAVAAGSRATIKNGVCEGAGLTMFESNINIGRWDVENVITTSTGSFVVDRTGGTGDMVFTRCQFLGVIGSVIAQLIDVGNTEFHGCYFNNTAGGEAFDMNTGSANLGGSENEFADGAANLFGSTVSATATGSLRLRNKTNPTPIASHATTMGWNANYNSAQITGGAAITKITVFASASATRLLDTDIKLICQTGATWSLSGGAGNDTNVVVASAGATTDKGDRVLHHRPITNYGWAEVGVT